MIFEQLSFLAVILLAGTSLALLLSQNWRWTILALAVQYLGIFWLVSLTWPVGLSVVKLVTGWMAGALLGASQPAEELVDPKYSGLPGLIFRLLAALMIWVLIFTAAPVLAGWLPAGRSVLTGGLLLIGLGLLHMGMSTRPLRVVLGLLTALSGFEVLYAVVENSVMVAGLTSIITLGLAMVGAYLMASPSMGDGA